MSDQDLFAAIMNRDLKSVSDIMNADLRRRLTLEQQDEPHEHYSNIEPNTGLRRHGEI